MTKIEMEGTFQGRVLEHAVGFTKNGFPQWEVRIAADRLFVPEDQRTDPAWAEYEIDGEGWIDCSSWDWSILGYFVMFNREKALLNYECVQRATGWDGAAFETLAAMDPASLTVQFRVEEDTYNNETKLKAQWIDEVGAPITRSLSSLDSGSLANLSAEFSGLMNSGKKPAPAKAPAKAAKPPAAPKAAKPPKAKGGPPKAEAPVLLSQEKAWEDLVDTRKLDDEAVGEAWLAACEQVGKAEDEFTDEDWTQVHGIVVAVMTQPA